MNRRFEVSRTDVLSPKIQTALKIVQLSDLHDARFGDKQDDLVRFLLSEKPDIIACTGDLFNRRNKNAFRNVFDLMDRIVSIAPVFVTEGNHEIALGETGERLLDEVQRRGAILLRNESRMFGSIQIIGLKQRASKETLSDLITYSGFRLVLCHRPELFECYCETKADLILCGHAHGGQIRLGRLGIYAPQQGLFPRYTSGTYERNGTKMFVSRGLGNTIPFPRIFNKPEVCVLRLLPQISCDALTSNEVL